MELTFICTMDCDNFIIVNDQPMPLSDKAEIAIGESSPGEIVSSIRLTFPRGSEQESIHVPLTALKELICNLSYFSYIIDHYHSDDNYKNALDKHAENGLLPFAEFIRRIHDCPLK